MSDLRTDRSSRPVPNAAPGPDAAAGGAKRMITAGIALGAVAAFGIGIWFAYDQGVKRGASGAPPLVRADQGPAKVAPENPGGMQVPNQDKQIYERLGNTTGNTGPQTEKLLPPPERPVASTTAPVVTPAPAGTMPAAGASVTIPTRPANAVPNQAPAPTATQAPAGTPAAPARQAAAPSPAPAAAPRPAATPAPAAATAGSARVQLASLPEQAQAQSTWAALQKKFPGDLGGLTANYDRVDIPGKGVFFRVQAGPLRDRAAAQALCEKLSAQKQGCIVVAR
ncbi:SPOR domain-containing protein [Ferrovibrio sp.]|uniref:SPOR domain-containing protein n=1 Tax=Ferrovibrio sp. TaxID=1917215 RepID=UPI001B3F6D0C|nr:SPOR domain-containing protein [Ferrovibrio sp.]MBP7066068.1 SPOR domain-containing protein [Ferrovibrio sp.]